MGKLKRLKDADGSVIYPIVVAEGVSMGTGNGTLAAKVTAIETAISDAKDESVVAIEALATPTTGYAKTYDIKQNSVSVGKIDIPSAPVQGVKVNGTAVSPDASGIVAITAPVQGVTLNGTAVTPDASGIVALTGLTAASITDTTDYTDIFS